MKWLTMLLVALAGFTSLSYELLWARAFGIMTAGRAFAFPMTLGLFLLGVALGARWSKKFSAKYETGSSDALRTVALFFGGACIVGYFSVPMMSFFSGLLGGASWPFALYVICGGAALFGAQFPLLAHHGIPPDEDAGAHLSYLYVANIIGSVVGTLVTGFVLMDLFGMMELITSFTVAGLLAALALFVFAEPDKGMRVKAGAGAVALCAAVVVAASTMFSLPMWERLLFPENGEVEVVRVMQNKSGVAIEDSRGIIYGGGVYDGIFSVDIIEDVNGIIRPWSVAAFHPNPERVLVIGLATGSWARAALAHPSVKEMIIVEIDPGYLELVSSHPDMKALIDDPRVTVVIDDGRRWLNANDEKFDAVISNTTWHWRSMASALLSVEFFELVKEHLNPGGIIMYNTTDSRTAVKAGLVTFDGVYSVLNSVIASPDPIDYDPDRLRAVLLEAKDGDKPLVDLSDPRKRERFEYIMKNFENADLDKSWVRNRERLERFAGDVSPTTDSNMGREWSTSWALDLIFPGAVTTETLWAIDAVEQ